MSSIYYTLTTETLTTNKLTTETLTINKLTTETLTINKLTTETLTTEICKIHGKVYLTNIIIIIL